MAKNLLKSPETRGSSPEEIAKQEALHQQQEAAAEFAAAHEAISTPPETKQAGSFVDIKTRLGQEPKPEEAHNEAGITLPITIPESEKAQHVERMLNASPEKGKTLGDLGDKLTKQLEELTK